MTRLRVLRSSRTTLQPSPLLRPSEAAPILGMARRTVEHWCRHGLLPGAFKTLGDELGPGHWRIPRATVEAAAADRDDEGGHA